MNDTIGRRELIAGLSATLGALILNCDRNDTSKAVVPGDVTQLDLSEASGAVARREVSPVELTKACLDRIDRVDQLLNSFITVTREQALEAARAAEHEIVAGRLRGPLHGIPIAIKDNIETAGIRTTAASGVFADRVPMEDADVVKKLKAAGAVLLGKLNMHEFAAGTTSAISHFGAVHNPWNLEYVAGGSSGGNGAAVAAGLCFGSVGTDTGGSIRIPASSCGVVGLKPTYDIVSTKGLIYVSRSFDHIGPICRTVADTALMFRAMTDHPVATAFDSNSPPAVSDIRVGLLKGVAPICDAAVEMEVETAFAQAVNVIRSMVASTRDAVLPMPELDGIIGFEEYAFHERSLSERPELYDPRTRENILEGKKVSRLEYLRMIKQLDKYRRTIGTAFSDVDIVLLPTLPGLPIRIADAGEPFALNACTFLFSLGGLPAISVPCGFSKSGLPIGLLMGGPPFSEGRLLALAYAYQKVTGWEKRRPSLS
ncbi:MAG: amidase [Pyrinomonadaceae bacterium]